MVSQGGTHLLPCVLRVRFCKHVISLSGGEAKRKDSRQSEDHVCPLCNVFSSMFPRRCRAGLLLPIAALFLPFIFAVPCTLMHCKQFQRCAPFPLAQKQMEPLAYFAPLVKAPVGAFCKCLMTKQSRSWPFK